ncbi:peroxiredoxin family protein [Pinibacter aurantiacus]|uniref:Thioredoxin family protein n=1 Tax=Pinibacter aurantiacus TaxID=2851599 RepID=A0A9E2SAK4_9BACT|nr:thioredoxin family protein [Pinibacter aurantiacus]MBV4357759.1 thioredoxin family protein [Pinibacter aurantiacus]
MKAIATTLATALLATASLSQAQTIQLDLPHFAGKQYVYQLFQGDKKDTIMTGALDKNGKTTLVIPARFKGYVGMSQFALAEGGGLDIVVNHENFTVRCTEAAPNIDNIFYIGSAENNFLMRQYQKQQAIMDKAGAMQMSMQAYGNTQSSVYSVADTAMHRVFENEFRQLSGQFSALQAQTLASPLYAAKFRTMNDVLMGIGSQLKLSESEKAEQTRIYMRNTLDWDAAYTSGHWSSLTSSWMQLQAEGIKSDSTLLSDAQHMLARTRSNLVYTALAEQFAGLFSKYNKDSLFQCMRIPIQKSGRLSSPSKKLQTMLNSLQAGSMAPPIIGLIDRAPAEKTLLVFYESGCGNCENELTQLTGNYTFLQGKGVRVITVSSDVNKLVFDYNAAKMPWSDKLCDFNGFEGVNFKSYGVIGTPTMFVINKEGKIEGRYARLADTGLMK